MQDSALLFFGLLLLLSGGEALVRGASSLASSLGISPLAIGLTVVAMGTSAPELAVNLTAAVEGKTDLSFGNVFGSNMANVGLVIGVCGLVRAFRIQSIVVSREIPMMLLGTVVTLTLFADPYTSGGPPQIDFADGLIMLLFFAVFLYYTVGELLRQRTHHPLLEDLVASQLPGVAPGVAFARDTLLTVAGMGALLLGAEWAVDGAVGLARHFGVSEVVIGITVVAVGTSLPELAAGIMATLRGHMEIAIGNVVGSNIFNLLLVLATTSCVRTIPLPADGLPDLIFASLMSVALLVVSLTYRRQILRAEAAGLLLLYIGYVTWRGLQL